MLLKRRLVFALAICLGGVRGSIQAFTFNPEEWIPKVVRGGIVLQNGDRKLRAVGENGGSAYYEGDTRVVGPMDSNQRLFQTLQAAFAQDAWTDVSEDNDGTLIIRSKLADTPISFKEDADPQYHYGKIDEDGIWGGWEALREDQHFERAMMDLKMHKYKNSPPASTTSDLQEEEEEEDDDKDAQKMNMLTNLDNWTDVTRHGSVYSIDFKPRDGSSSLSFDKETDLYTLRDGSESWYFADDAEDEAQKALISVMKSKMSFFDDRRKTMLSTVRPSRRNLANVSASAADDEEKAAVYEVRYLEKIYDSFLAGGLKNDMNQLEEWYGRLKAITTPHLFPLRDQLLSTPFKHTRSSNILNGFVKTATLNELFDRNPSASGASGSLTFNEGPKGAA